MFTHFNRTLFCIKLPLTRNVPKYRSNYHSNQINNDEFKNNFLLLKTIIVDNRTYYHHIYQLGKGFVKNNNFNVIPPRFIYSIN